MTYKEYQKAVYDWLLTTREKQPDFNFSVRQKASRRSELNYFIGTEKSGYFAFTFWDIPVAYPGSSADLTSFVFSGTDGNFICRYQFLTTRSPERLQEQVDLTLGERLQNTLQEVGVRLTPNSPTNRMFWFEVNTSQSGYPDIPSLMEGFYELYKIISPAIDQHIAELRSEYPDWKAGRFTDARWQELQRKMKERFSRFASIPTLPEPDEDEEEIIVAHDSAGMLPQGPLNTILYGPPGTGKTYTTKEKAVSIANPQFVPEGNTEEKKRESLKDEYDRLCREGQIEFVTFHQSMSYEDFIEGIKPVPPILGDTYLKYEVRPGILKRIAQAAHYRPDEQTATFSIPDSAFQKALFYKMSLGRAFDEEDEAIYKWCMQHGYVALGYGNDTDFTGKSETEIKALVKEQELDAFAGDAVKRFIHWIRKGDYILISAGNSICRAIGRVTGDYEFRADSPIRYHQFRKVEWLVKDVTIPVDEVYNKPFSMQSIYQLDRSELRKDFFVKAGGQPAASAYKPKNYVLIIDEINRGNVSQIFGELITLIEEDKRAGMPEALSVTLPYSPSNEKFSLPPNLYFLGTMNTADRSVEALDTALRRRFSFVEMPPRENHPLIEQTIPIGDAVVNFQKILSTINLRLEKLAGRDHKIGHSYFIPQEGWDWQDYFQAFTDKIIPLLQEYFYGDWAKMCLVLGEGFVTLKREPANKNNLFAALPGGNHVSIADSLTELQEKEVWELTTFPKDAHTNPEQQFADALKLLAADAVINTSSANQS